MECPKCQQEMEKKGTYESGNSQFERYQCTKCWKEQSKAIGIVGGMPSWSE